MEKKIAIVGHNDLGNTVLVNMIKKEVGEEIIIVNREDLDNETVNDQLNRYFDTKKFTDPIPYVANNSLNYYGGKEFICKGKHQYREVKTESDGYTSVEWICQCGRKIKH